jgi:cell division protein FtsN
MHFPASTQLNRVMALTVTVVVVGMSTVAFAQQSVESEAISQTNTPATDAPITDATSAALPDTITLGQPCNHPYVVAIPRPDEALLDRVQTIVGAAFITESRLGFYVQAGASPRRRPAEQVSRQLRRAGFDARVIYRPIACGS